MYTAIVWGHLAENEGQVNLPLARKPNSPPLYCVNEVLGKPSLTQWVVSGFEAEKIDSSNCLPHLVVLPY